ncbi:MAG: hypothetical protein JWM36_863 [Hyphomicrobiales bacterium]|nr:hypothetical protein [Hyphomicrobiales bacterium]
MARFFFDSQSELATYLDVEGCEYPNADVARSEAAKDARSRAAERVRTGTGLYDEMLIVRDDRGEVSRMTLAEAVASVLYGGVKRKSLGLSLGAALRPRHVGFIRTAIKINWLGGMGVQAYVMVLLCID